MVLANKVICQNGAIREFEKPEVCEAIKVANANRWTVALSPTEWDEREARLKKEYEKNTKAPGSGVEQPEEKIRIICCSASPKADFYYKHFLNEGNPALKESASQFNDALLDEQAKKIEELTEENERLKDQVAVIYACKENNEKYNLKQIKRLGKEIARLNRIIHKKNLKIEELRKESSRQLRGKMKMFVENVDLKKSLRKTESLLHDTRGANSRNLDTCFKNEDLIDELKKKLAEKTKLAKKYAKELSDSSLGLCKLEKQLKDKNAVLSDVAEELRLSKIREKNLTEVCQKYMKENEELKKKLADKVVDKIDAQALKSAESALAYKEKVIAEKDEVIADLGKELKEKHKKYVWYKGAYEAAHQILNSIADYAAKHPDKKFSDQKVGVDIAEEGGDHSGKIVLWGKDFVKKFEENGWFDLFEKKYKEKSEELSKVADEDFEQLLLFGEVIIKSEK